MSPSPGRTESVLGTCSCHVLCPEPQWHAPSLHYPSPPVGLCVCTHYLLGHITTRPGSLTSPGPQSSPRCLSVGVARSLALGRPDSGFPGIVGLCSAGACIPANVPSPRFPACLLLCLPEPSKERSSRPPGQATDPHPAGKGRAPVSDPPGPRPARAPPHSQGLEGPGLPRPR